MLQLQNQFSQLLLLTFVLLLAPQAYAHEPAAEMSAAAERFLQSLDQQQDKAVYEFSHDQQKNWHFLPDKFIKPDGARYGLPLEQMQPEQRALAYALVNTGLSHQGYLTTMTITSLEQILHDLENKNLIRNPLLYYVTIFGKPGDQQAWGWRFEGHHLSINITIVGGKLFSVTPSFFGTNPAIVKQGKHQGLQTLDQEENIARELVTSLSDDQRKVAIISEKAPDDIITSEQRKVEASSFTPAQGIACQDLNQQQQQVLLKLVKAYAEKYRPEIVSQIHQQTKLFDLQDLHFAWAGSLQQGQGHYYRIQSPKFLFEYDNTQNNANHVHAVWREFNGDFGTDLLRQHYDAHHNNK
ncbi:MAG: DUF3500 domain-containing protein [Pirellulales bacterium]